MDPTSSSMSVVIIPEEKLSEVTDIRRNPLFSPKEVKKYLTQTLTVDTSVDIKSHTSDVFSDSNR